MLVKNRLKIITKDKTIVSFNSMLLPALEQITSFLAYADFVAVGTGNAETSADQVTLQNYQATLPLVTDSFNFDPIKGELFLTKKQ